MFLLLFAVFELATTAASMAIEGPEAIADAPSGRSKAEDASGKSFLSREECAKRWGKKFADGVASRAIEAKPASGYIGHQ
jgi:hypothetical protein